MKLNYEIDGLPFSCTVNEATNFFFGETNALSEKFNDLTRAQDWYEDGYSFIKTEEFFDSTNVRKSLTREICNILKKHGVNVETKDFELKNYHKYVDHNTHQKVIAETRSLSPDDFNFDTAPFLKEMSNYFSKKLNWTSNGGYEPKIIARINLPQSENFNPAHKDVYQVFDLKDKIPQMVNIWVPICGVNSSTGLPVASGSHLFKESDISRTKAGIEMNGTHYNVNCVKSWGGSSALKTLSPSVDQMVIFSSHLVHGLARNLNQDETRVSLEFRLFAS